MTKPTVYFAVDKDGDEYSCNNKLVRESTYWLDSIYPENIVYLPKGTIKKLTGKDLTWEDEPLEWNG